MFNRLLEMNLSFDVRGWMFEAGRSTEDGVELVGTSYSVVAEDQDGYRWQHHHTFMSGSMVWDEDGFNHWHQDYKGDEAKAQALITKIEAHLKAGGSLNPDHWTQIQGCYGSEAWDERLEMELEAQEDRW